MPRRIRRTTPQPSDLDAEIGDYLLQRSMRERSSYHENTWKAKFMAVLEETGEEQEGGHRIIRLDEPIVFASYGNTGKMTEKEVIGIRRVRREITALNPDRVMALLEAKKLVEACTVTHTEIDEDAVLAANFEGRITDEEMDSLWDKSENFAFFLVEE